MKPYQSITILECHEPLVSIDLALFAVETPPPYEKLGADYGGRSPYYVRKSILQKLLAAQTRLQQDYPHWQIKIFDAYRPVEVQQFMVDYTFNAVLRERHLQLEILTETERQKIWAEVYTMWAVPSLDVAMPPPHSTGAAIDLTLVDEEGNTVDMGGEIDELSKRSHPNYYANSRDEQAQIYHARREILNKIMSAWDFCRHPHEWWHFSYGDQLWAWLKNQENSDSGRIDRHYIAKYGRI
jgi:zinc D-Ala-D-Ala dipeptidase